MKFNIVPSIIALALCALIAFGFYSWCKCAELNLTIAITGGTCLLLTIGMTLGISLPDTRTSVNVKVLSGVFTALLLISNIIFCCIEYVSIPLYIIINGGILLIWLLIVYGLIKAKQ